jgi:uncharacterized protein YbjQ (UPF0145 family)
MANPKDILVITTSGSEGLKIKKYLKPVSANIVAGTNLFSDFLGGFSDVFGGRSDSYQKQLSSLYNEAIQRLKNTTHEIGGNCVVGLSIDMDEISGKGKSMFMITAIGTAVIIEKEEKTIAKSDLKEKFENVGVERINNLRKRNEIIEKAKKNHLRYDNEIWNFIISNQVYEIFPFILVKHTKCIEEFQIHNETYEEFHKNFLNYVDCLDETIKINLIYEAVRTLENQQVSLYLTKVIKELNLLDFEKVLELLKNTNFLKKKIGVRVATYDKLFFNREDIDSLYQTKKFILENFKERGEKTIKKQLLSSKEKEVWDCECGNKSNEINENCGTCYKDIFGFHKDELKPIEVIQIIEQKIELIKEFIE